MADRLISLKSVSFSYTAGRPVLAGCNFHLMPGERVGLLGANGSGKTTLLALVVGLLRPSEGCVEAFGKVRHGEDDFYEVRCRAGMLFQDADDQLFSPTVAEDVAFGPLNLGKPREEVRRIVAQTLDRLGLAGYEDRITYQLSGGEKRLVALATVLAMEPEVLLLDEPIAGLDERSIERVTEILAGLSEAMVIVSHDREFVRNLSTRCLRLAGGRLQPVDLDHPLTDGGS